jgi:photosystem II stability/assembly factor-like uncharacterized protein
MKLRLFYLLLSLLSFSVQATPLKISAPVKNVTVGFNTMLIAPSDPNVMYGMSYIWTDHIARYIYRSIDAGQHWQEIPITQSFKKLMVSPTNPRMLYALLEGSSGESPNTNLFRSEDGGETWQAAFSDTERAQNCPQIATGSACLWFYSIGVDRSNGLTLYGTDSAYYGLEPYGSSPESFGAFNVKKSVDGGKTWKNIITIPEKQKDDTYNLSSYSNYNKVISSLSLLFFNNDAYIDPSNISYVVSYIIVDGSYDMKTQNIISSSHDAGDTWEVISANLPSNVYQAQLWFNSQNTNIIYANSSTISNNTIALKSIDHGVTWQNILPKMRFLGISPADPNTLYATTDNPSYFLMRSKDAGETWEKLAFPDTTATITAFLFSPVNAREIYVSTHGEYDTSGVYKSSDGGDTWEILKTGLNTNLRIIRVIPTIQKENIIVQLSNYEFYRTLDTGGSFRKISFPNLDAYFDKNTTFPTITASSRANTLYSYLAYSGRELYRSDDLGETWQKIFSWDSGEKPYDAAFLLQSSDGKILYTAKIIQDAISGKTTNFNWYYSEDFGNTWQAINSPTPIYAPTLHPTDSNILYTIGCGTFRSIDKGKTWHSITINIPIKINSYGEDNCVYPSDYSKGLQVDPHDANILYMLNVRGSVLGYRSTDAGLTWNPINYPDSYISGLQEQLDPKTGFLYAVATKASSVLGLTPSFEVSSIISFLVNVHYRSTDGGQTWVEIKTNTRQDDVNGRDILTVNKNELYMLSNPSGHSTDTYRSMGSDDAWQWVFKLSESITNYYLGRIGGQIDPLYNRFFTYNESDKGRLGIFTPDEEAIANPQSTISDAQGYSYPSSRDAVKTLVDSSHTTNKQLAQNTDTQITATFSPSAEYQNQSAELLIVSQFQPQGSTESYWFMQSNNTWQTWDGSEANLKPAKTVSSLQAMETLDIFTGKPLGLSGISTIYTGYRIPSQGVMVSNKNMPLVLKVE